MGWYRHPGGELQTIANVPWIPSLGIRYSLAADGISLTLLLLTGIVATAGILFSWNIEHRTKEFFRLLPRADWRRVWRVSQL